MSTNKDLPFYIIARYLFFSFAFNLINSIFKISSDVVKEFINNILFKTTSAEIRTTDNLSKNAYSKSVDSMQIIHNSGGGNCFFIAILNEFLQMMLGKLYMGKIMKMTIF